MESNEITAPDWLLAWPQFTSLLRGYLVRLGKLPPCEAKKSWLAQACVAARARSEPRQHLEALEEAASLCDGPASQALAKKFEGTLSRQPVAWKREDDHQFLDVVVELAAYGWLRRECRAVEPRFVPEGEDRSPDLEIVVQGNVVGVECKNVQPSKDASDRLLADEVISGVAQLSPAFADKIREKLESAAQQLAAYQCKIVFLHVTLDLGMPAGDLESTIRDMVPAGVRLVVFLNYDWRNPKTDTRQGEPSPSS